MVSGYAIFRYIFFQETMDNISTASCGNALGVGLGDFITRELFDKIDFQAIKENILTATFYQRGKIPLVLEDEREIIEVGEKHFKKRGKDKPKIILIRDTLNLSDIYVSEAVFEEVKDNANVEVVAEPREIEFDDKNRIIAEF